MEHLLIRLEVDGIEYYELKVLLVLPDTTAGGKGGGNGSRDIREGCAVRGGSTVCVGRRGFWAARDSSGFRQLLWVSAGVRRTRGGPVLHTTDTC